MKIKTFIFCGTIIWNILILSCSNETPGNNYPNISRYERLPTDIEKQSPETDSFPPILHSNDFQSPVPLPGPINTSGAEDSPFVLPDGQTMYSFFTPDVRISPQKQLLDDVTGVWMHKKSYSGRTEPTRVWLQKSELLALDGAVAVQNDEMWFASAREGYTNVNIFTSKLIQAKWSQWKYVGDRLMKEIQIGECHIHGDTLYFHSGRPRGMGDYDIWITIRSVDKWSDPINISVVNTKAMDGFPFVSSNGTELWFTRIYRGTPSIFRSKKNNGIWQKPELILERFAGEPTLDEEGNLYFVHHYYKNNVMIESDIYVCYKK